MKIFGDSIDPKKMVDPKQTNIPKNQEEENIKAFQENQEIKNQMVQRQVGEDLASERQAMGANSELFDQSVAVGVDRQKAENRAWVGTTDATIGSDTDIPLEDLSRSWLGEFQKSFTRGLGSQVIAGTGDMINFFASAAPWWTMKEGTFIGNALQDWGSDIEEENKTYISEMMNQKEITWGSLASPEFWSVNVAETIPLMLEFLAAGKGFATLGAKAAMKGTSALGRSRVGRSLLKGARQTEVNKALRIGAGEKQIYDITGSGSGISKHLLRNVEGALEASDLLKGASATVSAGISQNLMAGAMNGMELYKQMQDENENAIKMGQEPIYTDEQMAEAAAGTFTNNMAYLGVDMLSWGVTFGGVGKNISQGFSSTLKPVSQMLRTSAGKFASSMSPIAKSLAKSATQGTMTAGGRLGRVAGIATFEGFEESFQETFEEWAKMKAKAEITGEDVPSYFDFYNSDESRAIRILAGVSGGLFGGVTNLGAMVNKKAEEEYNIYDRNRTLQAKININDKLGRTAKQYSIENTLFDIATGSKDLDVVNSFIQDQIERANLTQEEADSFIEDYKTIESIMISTDSLNIKGKHAMAKHIFDKKRTERELANLTEEQKAEEINLQEFYGDDEVLLEEAKKRLGDQIAEKQTALLIKQAYLQANIENLMSGKVATPIADKFIMSKDGAEYHVAPEEITTKEEAQYVFDNGFVVAGLSEEMYNEYVSLSDDEIYKKAKEMNEKAIKEMKPKVKNIFNKLKDKFAKPKEEQEAGVEINEDEILATEKEKAIADGMSEEEAIKKAEEVLAKRKEEVAKQQEAKKKASEQSSPEAEQSTSTGKETPSKAKKPRKSDERKENELDYEKEAIESEEEPQGKSLEEVRAERAKKAEEAFKAKNAGGVIDEREVIPASAKVVPVNGKFKIQTGVDENGNPVYLQTKGKDREIATRERADELAKSFNEKQTSAKSSSPKKKSGKAFRIPKSFNPKTKSYESETKTTDTPSEVNSQLGFEEDVSESNKQFVDLKKKILEYNMYVNTAWGKKSGMNKIGTEPSRNEIDTYLDSTIGQWTMGPSVGQKARALNAFYQLNGINISVIDFRNLVETVGVDGLGYTLGKSIFIDERAWEQDYVLMHEAVHVLYRTLENTPIVARVLEFAYKDKALVERVRAFYENEIIYDFNIGDDLFFRGTYDEFNSLGEVPAGIEIVEAPRSEQKYINEELFAHAIQGPLSKRMGSDFQFTERLENQRQKEAQTFWSYVKEQVTGKPESKNNFNKVMTALNDGKKVPQEELYDFIARGFQSALKGNESVYTTKGYAMRISASNKQLMKELDAINSEKGAQGESFKDLKSFLDRNKEKNVQALRNIIRKNAEQEGIQAGWTREEIDFEIEQRIQEFENEKFEDGAFDDTEVTSLMRVKGATRVLRNFTRSFNYVKKQRHLRSGKSPGSLKNSDLLDSEWLISEFYNLAAETKGNTGMFIHTIQNSEVREVKEFYKYMQKTYPQEYLQILHEMGYLMSNLKTIQVVKEYTNKDGKTILENALSETEMHLSESRFRNLQELAAQYFKKENMDSPEMQQYEQFVEAMNDLKTTNPDSQSYITVLKMLAPYSIDTTKILEQGYLNFKGRRLSIEMVLNSMVRQADPSKTKYKNFYGNTIQEQRNPRISEDIKTVINAITDTGRQFSSRATVVNAEGNNMPARVTSNQAIVTTEAMVEFLTTKTKGKYPTFQAFKKRFGTIIPATKKSVENPILRMIYDDVTKRRGLPTLSQSGGHKSLKADKNSLYKNSDAYTELMNDFLAFEFGVDGNKAPGQYPQNMGAMGDSPRKFFINAPRHRGSQIFRSGGNFTLEGKKLLKSSYEILKGLGTDISTYEEYEKRVLDSMKDNRNLFETNGLDLMKNESFKRYFDQNSKLNEAGVKAVNEFTFNTIVNRTAIAEIFTPGISPKETMKRNKGVVAPVMSFGNPNLKINFLYVNDEGDPDNKNDKGSKSSTDSHLYVSQRDGEKIQNAAKILYPTNDAFKTLNSSVEKDNPNFGNRTALFKGHTTMITSDNANGSEKGMRGLYNLLMYQDSLLESEMGDMGMDLLNGKTNVISQITPASSIKSDFLTPEQKRKYKWITYDFIRDAWDQQAKTGLYEPVPGSDWEKLMNAYAEMNRDANGFFKGINASNFGLQQKMDQFTNKSGTPVQMISSVLSSAGVNGILPQAERIQSLIREEMASNLKKIEQDLGGMDKSKWKEYLLGYLDLEAMDQSQVDKLYSDINALEHPFLGDFVNNSFANILKVAGNKLKTNGAILQNKPDWFYEQPDGYYTGEGDNFGTGLKGYSDRTIETVGVDGTTTTRTGSGVLEIVLPKSHIKSENNKKGVTKRRYIKADSVELKALLESYPSLKKQYQKALGIENEQERREAMVEVTRQVALREAEKLHKPHGDQYGFGFKNQDNIGKFYDKNGTPLGYFVRGEFVIATRIPSHGPSMTNVFEVVDEITGPGNNVIAPRDFMEVIGADNDGDQMFVQWKGKDTPLFNQALDLMTQLWTSPEMYQMTREKIDVERDVNPVLKALGKTDEDSSLLPFSPEWFMNEYNNTMITKRGIGKIFNIHRTANYLATYNVGFEHDITINGKSANMFSDEFVNGQSRTLRSATLANIYLDNAKYAYADRLGMNDQTLSAFALLTNMNFPLVDIAKIMNSDVVKIYVDKMRKNNSLYTDRKTFAQIKRDVYAELSKGKKFGMTEQEFLKEGFSFNINTDEISSPKSQKQIMDLLSYLNQLNSDISTLTKITSGHNGINSNPFILENQLADFNALLDNKKEGQVLKFDNRFKNNPDIKAYKDVAEKSLTYLKEINKAYSATTKRIIDSLNGRFTLDERMTDEQLERATALINDFYASRLLGLNNLSVEQKNNLKKDLFNDLRAYIDSYKAAGNNINDSILFSRALNINFPAKTSSGEFGSYLLQANPRFFLGDGSVTEAEIDMVKREFEELPDVIKKNMILFDMMENGYQGATSLVRIFDDYTDSLISSDSSFQHSQKGKQLAPKVEQDLMNAIVANEFNNAESQIPKVDYDKSLQFDGANFNSIFRNPMLVNRLREEKPFYLKINGQPFYYEGMGRASFERLSEAELKNRIMEKFRPIKLIQGDIRSFVKSIPDTKSSVYSLDDMFEGYPSNYDNKADHMVLATLDFEDKKKSKAGKAYKIDIHNYNSRQPLTQHEFEIVNEFKPYVTSERKAELYKIYLDQKAEANALASKINSNTVKKLSDDELKKEYAKYAKKDMYAYSIITTPITIELANRAAIEQSKITGKFQTSEDMDLIGSFFNNNNIPSNHPAIQSLVRQLTIEQKKFAKERAKYIDKINKVTDALYDEKFKLSSNRFIRSIQGLYYSLLRNRNTVYEQLYGNLIVKEKVTTESGREIVDFRLRDRADVESDYKSGVISKAEYDFYNTFTEITKEFEGVGTNKKRKGYIPHTSMTTMEMLSTRGLLGLYVNSKGEDKALEEVKLYFNINGKKELVPFYEIKSIFNSEALSKGNDINSIREFRNLKKKAKELLKSSKNEDGSNIDFISVENASIIDMSPIDRFSKSRSISSTEMPSMDLNKALSDYVHSTLFTHGNSNFKGFKELIPLIDGVYAYSDKKGFKNASNYVKEVLKEKFIMKRDQDLFGKTTDKVLNGFVKGNLLYALGYKGFLVGKGVYAIGNAAIGKYMTIKREGGKDWLKGEARYWGVDKGIGEDSFRRMKRTSNILKNLGFMEISLYDDVAVEKKRGLDGFFTGLALLPMRITEDWVQKVHFLGKLTDEEFDKFDSEGNYKIGVEPIYEQRVAEIEERVMNSHGKGFTATTQSRIHNYALGRMFMQFSKHIPANIMERFRKEDVDIYGQKQIGSLRQFGRTVTDVLSGRVSIAEFKEYRNSLEPHQKEALDSAFRGMAMISVAGMLNAGMEDSHIGSVSESVISDANIYANPERMLFKTIPPAVRSTMTVTSNFY